MVGVNYINSNKDSGWILSHEVLKAFGARGCWYLIAVSGESGTPRMQIIDF